MKTNTVLKVRKRGLPMNPETPHIARYVGKGLDNQSVLKKLAKMGYNNIQIARINYIRYAIKNGTFGRSGVAGAAVAASPAVAAVMNGKKIGALISNVSINDKQKQIKLKAENKSFEHDIIKLSKMMTARKKLHIKRINRL